MTAPRWTIAFGAWTIFVWGTRIKNAIGDDGMGGPAKVAVILWSATLVAGGVAVIVRRHGGPGASGIGPLLVLTAGSWFVSAVSMVTGGRGAAFIAVDMTLPAL